MSPSSKNNRGARPEKLVGRDPLAMFALAAQKRRSRVLETLAAKFRREVKKLFSKNDLRELAAIAATVKREWHRAALQVRGDSGRLDRLKADARKKFGRLGAEARPNFRKWQTRRGRYLGDLKEAQRLAASVLDDRVHLDWDNLPELQSDAQEFGQPFTVVDVNTVDPFHLVSSDASFAHLDVGNLENNFVFDQDEVSFPLQGSLGLYPVRSATNQASCGINFTMPKAGRLQIGAVLQNFFNRVTFSVRDNVGFSSAYVSIELDLFVAVIRGHRVIHLPTPLVVYGLTSEGGNLSYTLSDIDNSQPYTVTGLTTESLPAGESVQILAGSQVQIGTQIDDMECHVNALLSWQLRKLIVEVV